jgi:hypothetical protein
VNAPGLFDPFQTVTRLFDMVTALFLEGKPQEFSVIGIVVNNEYLHSNPPWNFTELLCP